VCTANSANKVQLPVLKARVYGGFPHSFTSNYRFISNISSSVSSLDQINIVFINYFN